MEDDDDDAVEAEEEEETDEGQRRRRRRRRSFHDDETGPEIHAEKGCSLYDPQEAVWVEWMELAAVIQRMCRICRLRSPNLLRGVPPHISLYTQDTAPNMVTDTILPQVQTHGFMHSRSASHLQESQFLSAEENFPSREAFAPYSAPRGDPPRNTNDGYSGLGSERGEDSGISAWASMLSSQILGTLREQRFWPESPLNPFSPSAAAPPPPPAVSASSRVSDAQGQGRPRIASARDPPYHHDHHPYHPSLPQQQQHRHPQQRSRTTSGLSDEEFELVDPSPPSAEHWLPDYEY